MDRSVDRYDCITFTIIVICIIGLVYSSSLESDADTNTKIKLCSMSAYSHTERCQKFVDGYLK